MDFAAVQAVLNDLPRTFTRPGNPYAQLVDAESLALATATTGWDGLATQCASLSQALDGWIDVWGLLFGVPRNSGEGNAPYAGRIVATVAPIVGSLPAIQIWMNLFLPGGSVVDNAMAGNPPGPTGQVGYTLTFPAYATTAQIVLFLVGLARIRPAGVPFNIQQSGSGLFLGTINFLGKGQVAGSYLTATASASALGIGANTNSSPPLLPGLYLTDPTING